jgi:Spy/CpxP family protein refolding chaperone
MKNSNNRILTIAVVLLLIANIALVAFMVLGKNKDTRRDGGKGGPFEKMVKEIGMNESQKKQYDSLRELHFSIIRPLFDSMRSARQSLFKLIKEDSINDSLVNVYTSRITEKQIQADKQTLYHFREVRAMFSGEQQKKFDDFVQKMMQRSRKDSSNRKKD